jgi:Domain of unknown function (DUF1876)
MLNRWNVYLMFEEDENRTACTASLRGEGAPPNLKGHGYSRRNPSDQPDSRIGEEIAAARACSNLAHELLEQAAGVIESYTHRPAHITEWDPEPEDSERDPQTS